MAILESCFVLEKSQKMQKEESFYCLYCQYRNEIRDSINNNINSEDTNNNP